MEEINNQITNVETDVENDASNTDNETDVTVDCRGKEGKAGDPPGIQEPNDKQNSQPIESVQKLLNDVIKDYEAKFNDLKTATEKAIAERDEMIRSLLNGEKPQLTVADRINAQRNFKKW